LDDGQSGGVHSSEWPAVNPLAVPGCKYPVFSDPLIANPRQYLPGQGCFIKCPKNETSERLIAVPASTMALLKTCCEEI
jgi:hypothetical protein